jgi:hypothetical protein
MKLGDVLVKAVGALVSAFANAVKNKSANGTFDTSAGKIVLAGSVQGASNPPPGIQHGQCWHPGHGIGGGRSGTQWINSWIVDCGSPGSRGPV